MSSISENNKRIAQNTAILYARTIFTLFIGLFTSRVIIANLGISDYGVYNVMGGIIGMLSYVNTLFAGGTSRFLTIDLGKGDMDRLKQTFKLTNTTCGIAAILILLLGETIGLWFMMNKLNIDPDRMDAALWVYQCGIFSYILSVIQTPYMASVISHEKMSIFAYMTIYDVSMKLAVAALLAFIDTDKLKLYSVLMFGVTASSFIIYRYYCSRKFEECVFSFAYNKARIKEILTYSSWNLIGSFAMLLANNGINILLNIFFGTVINAARGIAMQVCHLVQQFYNTFQTASRPQIFKYYGQNDLQNMSKLICNNSKYCAMLLICIIIPLCTCTEGLLHIWLVDVPDYTTAFIILIMLQVFFQAIDTPVGMGIHAVGKMKLPNLTTAFVYMAIFPLTYVALKMGYSPISSYVFFLLSSPLILYLDLWILHKYTGFDRKNYVATALVPIAKTTIIASIIPAIIAFTIPSQDAIPTICKAVVSAISVCAVVFYIGIPKNIQVLVLKKLHLARS